MAKNKNGFSGLLGRKPNTEEKQVPKAKKIIIPIDDDPIENTRTEAIESALERKEEEVIVAPKTPKKEKPPSISKSKKVEKVSFTIRHTAETKALLDDIHWLKTFVIDKKEITHGEIVEEALQLLSKKINYKKLYQENETSITSAVKKMGRKMK